MTILLKFYINIMIDYEVQDFVFHYDFVFKIVKN